MDCFKGFSERLKKSIEESKKTQKEIADSIGISSHAFTKYLNGRIPETVIVYKLAKYFNKPMEWLLAGKNNPNGLQNENKTVEAVFDPDLKMIIDVMTNLLHNPDPNLRGWAIITFNEAFAKYIHIEEEKKEHA